MNETTTPSTVYEPTVGRDNAIGVERSPDDRTREAESSNLVTLPFITVLCVTFNRPALLANMVACFESQDYPMSRCQLIVLDDLGQYPEQPSGPNWDVISMPHRFETLSAKRNAVAAMSSRESDAIAYWDDDDAYAPWTLMSHAVALESSSVSHPSCVLHRSDAKGYWTTGTTGQTLYQASTAMDRELFLDIGGYPRGNTGVDQKLVAALRGVVGAFADPCAADGNGYPPSYVYGWEGTGSPHLSALGTEGYDGETLTDSADVGRRQQVTEFRPKSTRRWGVDVRAVLGISPDVPTHGLPTWWRDNAKNVLHRES